jgi:hypothetical protein
VKLRIFAVIAATALALISGAAAGSAAQAATTHAITNQGYDASITSHGSGEPVTLGGSTLYTVYSTDGHWDQYQVAGSNPALCLQANTADTVVSEGTCVLDNTRQQWWWDDYTWLINNAFRTFAYATSSHSQVDLAASAYCTSDDNTQCYWEVS